MADRPPPTCVPVATWISPPKKKLPTPAKTPTLPLKLFASSCRKLIDTLRGLSGYYQNLVELEREFDAAAARLTPTQKERADKVMNTERAENSEDVRILRLQQAIRSKEQS